MQDGGVNGHRDGDGDGDVNVDAMKSYNEITMTISCLWNILDCSKLDEHTQTIYGLVMNSFGDRNRKDSKGVS